jgi:hypothetical protein
MFGNYRSEISNAHFSFLQETYVVFPFPERFKTREGSRSVVQTSTPI